MDEIYLQSAVSAKVLIIATGPGTPSAYIHYNINGNLWVQNNAINTPFEVTGTDYWGLILTSGEMDRDLLVVRMHSTTGSEQERIIRTFDYDMTTIMPAIYNNVSLSLSAYETTGVASKVDIENSTSPDAIASAVSGAIVSGIGDWGDLRWSKVYGVPLDEWEVLITQYTV